MDVFIRVNILLIIGSVTLLGTTFSAPIADPDPVPSPEPVSNPDALPKADPKAGLTPLIYGAAALPGTAVAAASVPVAAASVSYAPIATLQTHHPSVVSVKNLPYAYLPTPLQYTYPTSLPIGYALNYPYVLLP